MSVVTEAPSIDWPGMTEGSLASGVNYEPSITQSIVGIVFIVSVSILMITAVAVIIWRILDRRRRPHRLGASVVEVAPKKRRKGIKLETLNEIAPEMKFAEIEIGDVYGIAQSVYSNKASLEREASSSTSPTCIVCLTAFDPESMVRVLTCRHVFHSSCFSRWTVKRTTCPICLHDLLDASPVPSTATAAVMMDRGGADDGTGTAEAVESCGGFSV